MSHVPTVADAASSLVRDVSYAPSSPPLTRRRCVSMLRWLGRSPHASLFSAPVDWRALGLHDYPQIVTHPLDLSTVAAWVDRVQTFDFDRFLHAVRLVWSNALRYNPVDNPVHGSAREMARLFEQRVHEAQTHPVDDDSDRLRLVLPPLVNALSQYDEATVFVRPVDPMEAPGYQSVVAYPICLDDVYDGLFDDVYVQRNDVLADLRLIWTNARAYNGADHPVSALADAMRQRTEELFAARTDDVDAAHIVTQDMRMTLLGTIERLHDADRLQLLMLMRTTSAHVVEDDVASGVSGVILDALHLKAFLKIDMAARRYLLARTHAKEHAVTSE